MLSKVTILSQPLEYPSLPDTSFYLIGIKLVIINILSNISCQQQLASKVLHFFAIKRLSKNRFSAIKLPNFHPAMTPTLQKSHIVNFKALSSI